MPINLPSNRCPPIKGFTPSNPPLQLFPPISPPPSISTGNRADIIGPTLCYQHQQPPPQPPWPSPDSSPPSAAQNVPKGS
ncbi:hypothetical protein CMV_013310 [Castanea mollissima]|uniref:Uncharacterized protein n=1 Tax=Castanea mollissima TaxID=60419 RepID=A0A8J4R012_9ROSI|nr:hypothetical protein CMV_013310 [Castanea mollissima]